MLHRILRYVVAVAYVVVAWTAAPKPLEAFIPFCSTAAGQCALVPNTEFCYWAEETYCDGEQMILHYGCWDGPCGAGTLLMSGECQSGEPCWE